MHSTIQVYVNDDAQLNGLVKGPEMEIAWIWGVASPMWRMGLSVTPDVTRRRHASGLSDGRPTPSCDRLLDLPHRALPFGFGRDTRM